MILNLFAIFDPYLRVFNLNWASGIIVLIIIPQRYWLYNSRYIYLIKSCLNYLWEDYKIVINNKFNIRNLFLLIRLFVFIILRNFMGLFPYVFTITRHLRFSMRFSLSIWLGLILFGWIKNIQHIFIHLVPVGTPFRLIFFIVIIESLRLIIRPLTLSIRLTANIIAGHLLLTLLSRFIPRNICSYMIILFVQILLLLLEIGVAIIQAYVYVILIILYLKETN